MTNWRRPATAVTVVAVGLLGVSPRADSPYQVICRSQTPVNWRVMDWDQTLYGFAAGDGTYSRLAALTSDVQYFWTDAVPPPRQFLFGLVQSWDGRFFGVGGTGTAAVVFAVQPDFAATYQIVAAFPGAAANWTNLGLGVDGLFYGTTSAGGQCGASSLPLTLNALVSARTRAESLSCGTSSAAGLPTTAS